MGFGGGFGRGLGALEAPWGVFLGGGNLFQVTFSEKRGPRSGFGGILAQFGGPWARFSIDFEGFLGPHAGVELGLLSLLHIMLSWLLDARLMGLGVIFSGSGRILERFGLEFEP